MTPGLATIERGPGGARVTFPHIADKYRETRAVLAGLKAIAGRRYDPLAQAWYVPAASSAELEVWAVEVGAVEVGAAPASSVAAEDPAELAAVRAERDALARDAAGLRADVERLTAALRAEKDRAGARAVADRAPRATRTAATPRKVAPARKARRVRGHYRYDPRTDGTYADWHLATFGVAAAAMPSGATSPRKPVADPVRHARALRVWRRAHHRYARRRAAGGGWLTTSAEKLAGRLLMEMQRATDFTPAQRAAQKEKGAWPMTHR